MSVWGLQVTYDLSCPARGRARTLDPSHVQPGDDLLHVAVPIVVGQRHRHVAFAVGLPKQGPARPTDRHPAAAAHADDATVSGGPVEGT